MIDLSIYRWLQRAAISMCAAALCLAPLAARPPLRLLSVGFAQRSAQIGERALPRDTSAELALPRDPFDDSAALRHLSRKGLPVRLSAVILGADPRAIVEENGRIRIVGIGDIVDGTRISTLSHDGLVLTDGRRIVMKETACATPC